jgi:hypothetical protein
MPNQITVIRPYRWEGMWVFDDPRVGLDKEPFVGGADTIIDLALAEKGIRGVSEGFLLLFSAGPFPGADLELTWLREEMGGNVYAWRDREGWLCPALLRYFPNAPAKLYAQFKELVRQD